MSITNLPISAAGSKLHEQPSGVPTLRPSKMPARMLPSEVNETTGSSSLLKPTAGSQIHCHSRPPLVVSRKP